MKIIVLLILSLASVCTSANIVVVNNKAFKLAPIEKKLCGEKDGPVFAAELFLMFSTHGLGLKFSQAQCSAGVIKHCNSQYQKKYALKSLFNFMRQYPPTYHSIGCRDLRAKGCTDICMRENVYSDEYCLIECNQYESYNR